MNSITTPLDALLDALPPEGLDLATLAARIRAEPARVLAWAELLERQGALRLIFPLFGKGRAIPIQRAAPCLPGEMPVGSESYAVQADGISAQVSIVLKPGAAGTYLLQAPTLGPGTEALLKDIIEIHAGRAELPSYPRSWPERRLYLDSQLVLTRAILRERAGELPEETASALAAMAVHRARGLKDLELYLADDWLEELAITGSRFPMAVYHRKHGWLETERRFQDDEEIYSFAAIIGRQMGKEITMRTPIVDAPLYQGDRSISTLYPVSSLGNTVTIRRFARNPWTLADLLSSGNLSVEMAALLWQAMQFEINILIAGSTASGKTSLLNALCALLPNAQRIVSIEDTRELSLPETLAWNWVPLAVRQQNQQGEGTIEMLDLMVSALRMRPDRLVIGEVRRREQVLTMFEAMNTGHAVYSTLHADTADQVVRRLVEAPLSVPARDVQALQLVVVQHRDRRTGLRRTREIAEVLHLPGDEVKLNYLFRWQPRKDAFDEVSQSVRLAEELNLHTGLSLQDLAKDRKEKAELLEWLAKQKPGLADFGRLMHLFYQDSAALLASIRRKSPLDEVLK